MALGGTARSPEIMASYHFLSVNLIYTPYVTYGGRDYRKDIVYIGILFSPSFQLNSFNITPLAGYFNRRLVSLYGTRINIGFEVSSHISEYLSIYIKHLSNAGMGRSNPGVDHIGIKVHL